MLIYDKKDDKVLIYEMKGDSEKIKRYKKGVISRNKVQDLFCSLKTNSSRAAKDFDILEEVSFATIDHDYYDPLGPNDYSELRVIEIRKDILERYFYGEYDGILPVSVYSYDDKFNKEYIHRFLKTEELEEKNVNFLRSWEFNNLIDLPRELYLLQLLLLGKYDRVVSENIRKQLGLFDINYLKSISLLDLKDMLETGLVSGSMEDIENKASIGGRILAKRR